jgi:hypothetical protein
VWESIEVVGDAVVPAGDDEGEGDFAALTTAALRAHRLYHESQLSDSYSSVEKNRWSFVNAQHRDEVLPDSRSFNQTKNKQRSSLSSSVKQSKAIKYYTRHCYSIHWHDVLLSIL